jgi:adenylate kinase
MLNLTLPNVPVVERWHIGRRLKMLNEGINMLKRKEYEIFIKDGQFVAPLEAIFLFDRIWNQLSLNNTKRVVFPEEIVWVNGAPGSGKGTNTRNIMRELKISARPIVVSDLLNADKFRQKIDQGLLIDDEEVTLLVFEKIIEENHQRGIIIDGYPRTKLQAQCIQLLQIKMEKTNPIRMAGIVLLIDEKTSVQRQLMRGQDAIEHNQKVTREGKGELMVIRKTDQDPVVAHARYNEFYEKTHPAMRTLKKFVAYHEVDAKGSLQEVKERIREALKKR